MTLLVASFPEFLQFLKIVMWISIPLFLVSTLVVVFLHYRNKRKQSFADIPALDFPSQPSSGFSWQSAYQQQLQAGKEQFQLLEKDFRKIKNSYTSLTFSAVAGNDTIAQDWQQRINEYETNIASLQQTIEQLQQSTDADHIRASAATWIAEKEAEIKRLHGLIESSNREILLLNEQNQSKEQQIQKMDQLLKELQESARQASRDARGMQLSLQEHNEDRDKQHFDENKRLNDQLKELHEQFKKLEEENTQLLEALQQDRIVSLAIDDSELKIENLQHALIKTEQELLVLKNKLVDAASLEDIVEEKNKQLEFLQQQLDQRIRNGRQSEQRLFDLEAQMHQLHQQLESDVQKLSYLQEDRQIKEEEIANLNRQIQDGITENRDLKQFNLNATDRIALLESEAVQRGEQLAGMQQELERQLAITASANTALAETTERIQLLESNLMQRQQLISRLHADLTAFADSMPQESN